MARATGTFDDPTIALQASKVESVTLRSMSLVLALVIHNPNGFPLRPRALHYRLSVNHAVVAEGSNVVGASVPASSSLAVEVPIEVSREGLSNTAPDAVVVGEIPYDLNVRISFESWFREREIQFTTSSVLLLNLPLGLANAASPNTRR